MGGYTLDSLQSEAIKASDAWEFKESYISGKLYKWIAMIDKCMQSEVIWRKKHGLKLGVSLCMIASDKTFVTQKQVKRKKRCAERSGARTMPLNRTTSTLVPLVPPVLSLQLEQTSAKVE